MPKMHAGTNELYDAKAEAFFGKRSICSKSIYYCGDKLVEVKSITVTAYKSEINVKWLDLDQRDEPANVYAAKQNETRKL
jgi:HAE1 family hydrophobic/amphiphilic exporter-1